MLLRAPENKEQESETRDDVTAEVVERFVQEMAEGHDYQDKAEGDKSVAGAQAQNHQSSGKEFDQRNSDTYEPKRPDGQKCIGEGQEIFTGMLERP